MSYEPYTIEIISQHSDFKGKNLRKYAIDGTPTVGAWRDEPFEVIFKNNTNSKVQVKLSVDGTDILTGAVADTEINKDMWMVSAYGSLALKAWPETTNGGAQFVFTSGENGVGLHVHGDVSSRGIIAAAVYAENYKPPVYESYRRKDYWLGGTGNWGGILRSTSFSNSVDNTTKGLESFTLSDASQNYTDSRELKSVAAVGAGNFVEQKISYVAGLIDPKFDRVVKVKYVWWEDLVSTLKSIGQNPYPTGTGFPGDEKKLMSLGSSPRLGTSPPLPQLVQYSRF